MKEANIAVAGVLDRDLEATIKRWMDRVNEVPELTKIPLSYDQRTGHLPRLLKDVIVRLNLVEGAVAPKSTSAHDHGEVRFKQGY